MPRLQSHSTFEDIFIYCKNPNYIAKLNASLTHLASKKAFNIYELGEKIIKLLVDSNLISEIRDILLTKG